MLVNPAVFAAPALWQGLMLLAVVGWGLWMFAGTRRPTTRAVQKSMALLFVVGLVLIPVCNALVK